jgi:hypothetical protein
LEMIRTYRSQVIHWNSFYCVIPIT